TRADVAHPSVRFVEREPSHRLDALMETDALEMLEHHEHTILGLLPEIAKVDDLREIGALQRGGDLGLAEETPARLLVESHLDIHELHRDGGVVVCVLSAPHGPHRPFPQEVEEPIAAGDELTLHGKQTVSDLRGTGRTVPTRETR